MTAGIAKLCIASASSNLIKCPKRSWAVVEYLEYLHYEELDAQTYHKHDGLNLMVSVQRPKCKNSHLDTSTSELTVQLVKVPPEVRETILKLWYLFS